MFYSVISKLLCVYIIVSMYTGMENQASPIQGRKGGTRESHYCILSHFKTISLQFLG